MKIAIRVDSSLEIGLGHVMRCITLANELRSMGADCTFICREFPGNLIDYIRLCKFKVKSLPFVACTINQSDFFNVKNKQDYGLWLGVNSHLDALQTQAALGIDSIEWLIVDHYGVNMQWETSMRPFSRHLMVIDDLNDRMHDCDLLLNQNLGYEANDYRNMTPECCQIIVGPAYALLRPEFAELRPTSLKRRINRQLHKILISLGGADINNITEKVLDSLIFCQLPKECQLLVVMGPHAPCLEKVITKAKNMPWRTEVIVNTNYMAQLMVDSDLAIGAAGVTSWERCVLGLPSLIIIIAENQRIIGHSLDKVGAARLVDMSNIDEGIRNFFSCSNDISQMLRILSATAASITEGRGAQIIAKKIYEYI